MSEEKMTLLDDERLIENAAMCSQHKPLIDDKSVNECIVLNVCKPLRDEIESLRAKVAELERESEKRARCLCFFRSVIKSGEAWSNRCKSDFDSAMSRWEDT